MSKREVEAALTRRLGMSPEQREYVEQQTKDLKWFAFKDGKMIEGTLTELKNVA